MSGEDKKDGKKSGINVTISEQTTDKITDALLDTFSAVQHGLGMLGDYVKTARILRQMTLLKTLNQAKDIADKEGLQIELPPPKFLLPYLEKASLENDNDKELHEKWARLLVNAGSNPDSYAYVARTMLSEISSNEAKILDKLVDSSDMASFTDYAAYWRDLNTKLKDLSNSIDETVKSLEATDNFGEKEILDCVTENARNLIMIGFSINTEKGEFKKRRNGNHINFYSASFDQDYHHFQILEGHRIIERLDYTPENWIRGKITSIDYVRFTKLGFGVIGKLYPKEQPRSEEVPPSEKT